MLTGKSLDRFIDEYWENDGAGEELTADESGAEEREPEKYSLADDVCIRPVQKGKVEKRTWAALLIMAVFVPLLLFLSAHFFHGQRYMLFSVLIVVFAIVPFFLVFEGRKPQAREIMVIAVLAAIGVAGRAAFFMLPNFKPVAAIVIITGVSFGGEAGFLVGCFIMMISNMFMGQGPWTPWQMFTYGMIGFLTGILFQKGLLKAKRLNLCIYGFFSTFFIYWLIMNGANLIMAQGRFSAGGLLAVYISGFPMDLVQAAATFIFLWFLSRPLLEKLERIKVKYGLIPKSGGL